MEFQAPAHAAPILTTSHSPLKKLGLLEEITDSRTGWRVSRRRCEKTARSPSWLERGLRDGASCTSGTSKAKAAPLPF